LHCCCTLAAAMSVLFMICWQKQTPMIEPYEPESSYLWNSWTNLHNDNMKVTQKSVES
jgi:hypothetical protein